MSFPPTSSAADRARSVHVQPAPPPQLSEGWPETDHPALTKLRDGSAAEKGEALQQLFWAYARPIRCYIRQHWPLLPEADIDDLASEFSAMCLTGEKPHFLTYEPERPEGSVRLRTYLRTVLDNFLRNHRRRSKAQIRGGGREFESLDTISPAAHQEAQADEANSSQGVDIEAYDRHWAQHILSVAFGALENGTPATREWLVILRPWILADPGDATLKEVAGDKGCTHALVRTQLHRLRKAWRQAVRQAVADTLGATEDIDDELRHLAAVLSRHSVD